MFEGMGGACGVGCGALVSFLSVVGAFFVFFAFFLDCFFAMVYASAIMLVSPCESVLKMSRLVAPVLSR